MAFVFDASIAARWLPPDERADIADALAMRMQLGDALAPDLFWHETRSLMVTAVRRNRIPEAALYSRSNGWRPFRCETPAKRCADRGSARDPARPFGL
jgi:predicted nucleic acid-binding protein